MEDSNTHSSKSQLWSALERLMIQRYGRINLARLSRDANIGLGTVARIQNADAGITLHNIEKLAAVFGLSASQLLDPNITLEKSSPQLSERALMLARQFDEITDPMAQAQAYAMFLQYLQFANLPLGKKP